MFFMFYIVYYLLFIIYYLIHKLKDKNTKTINLETYYFIKTDNLIPFGKLVFED